MNHKQIDVWKIAMPNFYANEEYYYSLLSEKEKTRSKAFITKQLTSRYVISQGVLRQLLGRYLSKDPSTIEYTYGPYRKPYVSNDLQFNLTHSHDIALIGISLVDEIGIDVELCDPKMIEKDLEKSVFSENELRIYQESSKKLEAFCSAWTHKEALMKLAGVGLYKELKEVEVPLNIVYDTSKVLYEDRECYLRSFFLEEGYIGAVASTKPNFEMIIQDYLQ